MASINAQPDYLQRAQARLHALKTGGLQRQRLVRSGAAGRFITLDGTPCLNFSSNDYLGLSSHPALLSAATGAARKYGNGSSGSALVSGYSEPLHELEQHIALLTGRSSAVVFSSGYLANLALAQVFCQRGQTVLEDRLNHASLIDSAQLAACRLRRYRHTDVADLSRKIQRQPEGQVGLVCSDAVFSMDGDTAPLSELAQSCAKAGVLLAVDDAHGMGVFGPAANNQGQGSVAAAGLDESQVPLLCGTLGKAYAAAGAFVSGPAALVELLVQTARTYLFNTALPPAVAATALAAIRISRDESGHRHRLFANIARFRQLASTAGLPLGDVSGPIQPVFIGDESRATAAELALRQRGFFVRAMRYPTVAKGQARLRITLTACHRRIDLQRLVQALSEVVPEAEEQRGKARD